MQVSASCTNKPWSKRFDLMDTIKKLLGFRHQNALVSKRYLFNCCRIICLPILQTVLHHQQNSKPILFKLKLLFWTLFYSSNLLDPFISIQKLYFEFFINGVLGIILKRALIPGIEMTRELWCKESSSALFVGHFLGSLKNIELVQLSVKNK